MEDSIVLMSFLSLIKVIIILFYFCLLLLYLSHLMKK